VSPVQRVSSDAVSFGDSFRVPNAAELIAQDIRTKIVRGQLKEGNVLPPEQELTDRFGVSRPVLRQALRILESERLVEVRRGQHGGAVVRRPDAATVARHFGLLLQYEGAQLHEVFQARRLLEEPAARRATEQPDPSLLDALQDNLDRNQELLEADGLDLRLQAIANDFHNLLVAHRGNTALVLLDAMLDNVIRITSESLVESQATTDDRLRLNQRSLKSHQNLYQLIQSGDTEAADTMWRSHLAEVSDYYMTTAPQSGLVVDLMSSHS
jgi:GntR family transcriptional repressor for pyruvate dehydrogenase complex